jgi:hypothetical protein
MRDIELTGSNVDTCLPSSNTAKVGKVNDVDGRANRSEQEDKKDEG